LSILLISKRDGERVGTLPRYETSTGTLVIMETLARVSSLRSLSW